MNPIGDAAAVDDLARTYRREAQRIEQAFIGALRQLEAMLRTRQWEGKRASRMMKGLLQERRTIVREAHELRSIASELEGHADWIRRTIRELEGIERSIRHWAALNPADPASPTPDASLIDGWPPYCSLDWRTLRRRLRAQGAGIQ